MSMELNEIKKAIYKQNPVANFNRVFKGTAHYSASIESEDVNAELRFEIPVSDMGDASFLSKMEAKFLIRWLA
jgi:hypothetical protein